MTEHKAHIHIIGGGIAGLSAAYYAARTSAAVTLYESSPQLGGRCRSYFDEKLQTTLDNGNHILLRANEHVWELIETLKLRERFHPFQSQYEIHDTQSADSWEIHPPMRIPYLGWKEKLALLSLARAKEKAVVADHFSHDSLFYQRVVVPLCISALNTSPEKASAKLFARILKKLLMQPKGGQFSYPKQHWQDALIAPLLRACEDMHVRILTEKPLKHFEAPQNHITQLHIGNTLVAVAPHERVIFALPPSGLHHVLPNQSSPTQQEGIINGHFMYPHAEKAGRIVGLVGGTADWVFCKPELVSTTTSASSRIAQTDHIELAALLWADVCRAVGLDSHSPVPPYRIVHEKRATFAATPEQSNRRIQAQTDYENLFLAGDFTDTGLPATIEGAVLSGKRAAALATN